MSAAYYPVFLDLRDKPVVVVGAGKVALRKVAGLLEAGARVKVVAPECDAGFDHLPVRLLRRRFRASDLDGAFLALAATNDRRVNARVAGEARRRGIPVNVADDPAACGFLVPARIRRGNLQIAVSTSGRAPRLARELRLQIEKILDETIKDH